MSYAGIGPRGSYVPGIPIFQEEEAELTDLLPEVAKEVEAKYSRIPESELTRWNKRFNNLADICSEAIKINSASYLGSQQAAKVVAVPLKAVERLMQTEIATIAKLAER
jgi:hypothetical protein